MIGVGLTLLQFDMGRLPRRTAVCIALIFLLHLALLWLATRPVQLPVVRDNQVWVQLLRPQQPLSVRKKPEAAPVIAAQPKATLPAARLPAMPERPSAPQEPVPKTADHPEEEVLLADTPATNAAPNAQPGDAMQRALKEAGAVDRHLRSLRRQEFTAPPNTPATRLARGLAAAHAAVKPKWFEQARIELFSAPNDPKRIYRITTAIGEYCLFYPDKSSISANSNPNAGFATFGQPTMAACPIVF